MSETLLNYQRVLEKLQETAEKVMDVTELLESQSDLVITHNSNQSSHPFLLQKIQQLESGTATLTQINNALEAHNNSSTAHLALKTQVNQLASDLTNLSNTLASIQSQVNNNTTTQTYVNTKIQEHNTSSNTHADIRALISQINDNITNAAATVDAHNNSSTAHNDIRTSLSNTNTNMSNLSSQITSISNQLVNINQIISDIVANNGAIIDLNSFETNLPSVVKPGQNYTALFTGLDPSKFIITSIDPMTSGFTFSKTSNINIDENIIVSVPSNSTRELKSFKVTVKSTTTEVQSSKIFSIQVNRIPLTSGIIITGIPNYIKPASTITNVAITGATDPDGQTLSYSIACNRSYVSFSKSSNIQDGEAISVTVNGSATRGEDLTFTVTVSDGLETASKQIIIGAVNRIPVSSSIVFNNMPVAVTPNFTVTNVSLTGATDLDNQNLVYSISCDKNYVTFSKSENIAPNETFNITYSAAAVRGETPTFTITVSDGLETAQKIIATGTVSEIPSASGITFISELPSVTYGGTVYTIEFNPISNPEGPAFTYQLSSNVSGTNIVMVTNTKYNVTFPKVSDETPATVSIKVVNHLGEVSSDSKTTSTTLSPIYITAQATITAPADGATINLPYDVQLSAYSYYIDL